MTQLNFSKKEKIIIFIVILSITLISLFTKFYGSVDIGDYSDVAKYFSGDYPAKIRSSHSYLYGFLMAIPYKLLGIVAFKIVSLIFLFALSFAVYYFSGKSKKALWLMLFSPILWYMAPWISPIPLSSFLFFFAYVYIKKYESNQKIKYLLFSGILAGMSCAFWDAILFFTFILEISFLFNKKFYNFLLFALAVILGLLPKLVLDQYLFNFLFYGIIRYFFGLCSAFIFGGIYGTMKPLSTQLSILLILLFTPIFTHLILKDFRTNKNRNIFFILTLLILFEQTQIRYFLLIFPLLVFELSRSITDRQFRIQMIFSFILILIIIFPYLIQIKHSTTSSELFVWITNRGKFNILPNQELLLVEDIHAIVNDFPNSSFIVGNLVDSYQDLAHRYSGKFVKEFVSIQDYNLFLENKTVLFQRTFTTIPRISDRRQIWISGGISRNTNDETDYSSINLGIGVGEPINLPNFSLIKKYNYLYLSQKNISLKNSSIHFWIYLIFSIVIPG